MSVSVHLAIRALVCSRDYPSQTIDWLVSPTIHLQSSPNLQHILCDHCKYRLQCLLALFRALPMPSCIRILVTGGQRTTWVLYRPQNHNQSHLCPCRNCVCDILGISNCTDLYRFELDPEFSHKVLRGGYSCAWLYVSLILSAVIYCIRRCLLII
jgi:hypothetical protein